MSYANGRLPNSALSPILGGRLEHGAAAAWNALNARVGHQLRPLGGMSSYRTINQQWYLWNYSSHPHNTNWVAYPGTSNHGWGLAVDLANPRMRQIIDAFGAPFGWAKKWSDAPAEYWHLKYRAGIYHPRPRRPVLHRGDTGKAVRKLQRRLRRHGFKSVRVTGYFGVLTFRAVKRLQKKHHLHVDGRVGPKTWRILLH